MPLNVVERTLVPMRRCHSRALQKKAGISCSEDGKFGIMFQCTGCMEPILNLETKYMWCQILISGMILDMRRLVCNHDLWCSRPWNKNIIVFPVAELFKKFRHASLPVVIRIWFKCCCVEQAIVPSNQGLPAVTFCVVLC